jgi:hypothetical protein
MTARELKPTAVAVIHSLCEAVLPVERGRNKSGDNRTPSHGQDERWRTSVRVNSFALGSC